MATAHSVPERLSPLRTKLLWMMILGLQMIMALYFIQDYHKYTPRSPKGRPIVVITGATSGIGYDLSRRLVKDGFEIFGTYSNENEKASLRMMGVQPLRMDASNLTSVTLAEQEVRKYLERSKREFLGIISSASEFIAGPLGDVDQQHIDDTLDVHLKGTVNFVKVFQKLIMSQKGGRIVIMGSLAAVLLPRSNAVYNAAKAGQHAFARSLRQELAALDVSVSVIVCGETGGNQLTEKANTENTTWSGGFQNISDEVSRWMGSSFMGTTFDDIHRVVKHALTDSRTMAEYWAPPFLEFALFFTPKVLIQAII